MEAKELRIGNLCKDSLTDEWLIIIDLSRKNIGTQVIDRSKFPPPKGWQLAPISLTPEILEKCGFEKDGDDWKNEIASVMRFDDGYRLLAHEYVYGKTFTYLHELQNIIYALFGIELEVNL